MKEGHSVQWNVDTNTSCGWDQECVGAGNSLYDNVLSSMGNGGYSYGHVMKKNGDLETHIQNCKTLCAANADCGGFQLINEFSSIPALIDGCAFVKNANCGIALDSSRDCYELDRNPSAVATGDPHFSTWSGRKFDFHGVCDLVLIHNPEFQQGLGLEIHVRTKKMKQFSFISSAVLQVGHESLEVMGDIHKNLFWINKMQGEDTDNEGIIGEINGYDINYQKVNSKQHEFIVNVGGASISMKTYKNFVHVGVSDATESSFGLSKGLFGAYGTGELTSRDGSKTFENMDEFGQEWQVRPGDGSLFHEVEGPQAPDKCQMPLATNVRRRLAESNVSQEDAKLSCAHVDPGVFEMCVFDVMATGDNGVAGAY